MATQGALVKIVVTSSPYEGKSEEVALPFAQSIARAIYVDSPGNKLIFKVCGWLQDAFKEAANTLQFCDQRGVPVGNVAVRY